MSKRIRRNAKPKTWKPGQRVWVQGTDGVPSARARIIGQAEGGYVLEYIAGPRKGWGDLVDPSLLFARKPRATSGKKKGTSRKQNPSPAKQRVTATSRQEERARKTIEKLARRYKKLDDWSRETVMRWITLNQRQRTRATKKMLGHIETLTRLHRQALNILQDPHSAKNRWQLSHLPVYDNFATLAELAGEFGAVSSMEAAQFARSARAKAGELTQVAQAGSLAQPPAHPVRQPNPSLLEVTQHWVPRKGEQVWAERMAQRATVRGVELLHGVPVYELDMEDRTRDWAPKGELTPINAATAYQHDPVYGRMSVGDVVMLASDGLHAVGRVVQLLDSGTYRTDSFVLELQGSSRPVLADSERVTLVLKASPSRHRNPPRRNRTALRAQFLADVRRLAHGLKQQPRPAPHTRALRPPAPSMTRSHSANAKADALLQMMETL